MVIAYIPAFIWHQDICNRRGDEGRKSHINQYGNIVKRDDHYALYTVIATRLPHCGIMTPYGTTEVDQH